MRTITHDARDLQPGDAVVTPRGHGTVVAIFPAEKRPHMGSYTVKLPGWSYAVPFYRRELRWVPEGIERRRSGLREAA